MSIDFITLREQVVQFGLATDASERGLSELAGGIEIIFNGNDGLHRIHYPEVDHGTHLHRYVVARDHILRGDIGRDKTKAHPLHAVNIRDENDQPRSLGTNHPPQPKDHPALVFIENTDRIG